MLVFEGSEIEVVAGANERGTATGPSLVVVPPGTARMTVRRAGYMVRIFTARSSVVAKAVNKQTYSAENYGITPLPTLPEPEGPGTVRVLSLAKVPEVPGRLGRIYRSGSLMVNWFAPQDGPRDTDDLSPHVHADFEQASVTVAGAYVHHVRRPWTKRLRDWRGDEHVQVSSPSVTLIPPGNVHTTRAVGEGLHQLIDVFAPPRSDFIDQGWVLNQSAYEPESKGT
ncbi:hypothetical protein [Amycolatopsis pigmentata]|uniref:Cupin type-1 domain-containing protein n=1 Tax=Amycolatopsis pigmentata TaxID=450801 RepID=A0ABW5FNU6_9PSEU